MGTTNDLDACATSAEFYATELALNTAHPTGTDGMFAIVGATDTIWVWSSASNAWVDSSVSSLQTARVWEVDDVVYLQTLIAGVWTNTGTQWDV